MNTNINVDQYAQQQCWQFLTITAQQPPYVPNRNFGRLQNYVPYVSAMAASEIQNKANANPLRMFMFNISAENGFRNEYFETVLGGILGATELLVSSGQAASPENALQSAVSTMITLMAGALTREFPRLQAYITDPSLIAEIQSHIAKYDSIGQQVQNMRVQLQQQAMQPAGGGWGQPGAAQNSTAGFTSWAAVSGGAGAAAPAQTTWGQNQMGWNQVQPLGGAAQVQQPTGGPISDRYSNISTVDASAVTTVDAGSTSFSNRFSIPGDVETVAPIVENKAVEQVNQVMQSVVSNVVANFVKSAQYPYFMAYHPASTLSTLEVRQDGTTLPTFTQLDPDDMEYDSHAMITNAFGTPPASLNLTETNEALDLVRLGVMRVNTEAANLAAALDTQDKPEEERLQKPKEVTVAQEWIIEPSETMAWTNGAIKRLNSAQANGMPDVYRQYAIVAKPLVGDTLESESITKLGASLTYVSLAENLKASYESLSPAMYNLINRKMTVVVNRSLRQELGMSPGTVASAITNFRDDIETLIEMLEVEYGPVLKNAFLTRQRIHIRNALRALEEDQREKLTDAILGVPDEAAGRNIVNFVCSNYSMTFLNALAWELNVEMPDDGTPSQLSQELTPVLYDLVDGIFKDAADITEQEGNNQVSTIARHLIRTRDGRILEATRGALVEGAYLLSLIE